ncbi:T-cell activation inhibitor, mitochondrial-like [Dreissena polymorpha]|uniref:T-cell activation inhibitor, mitochondrial n=1 Tax=Dreissena polymorpha TaxID=45954 RepID=A0A9D4QZW3_DREPO|nr:T-cell activation inhibitor, mitochondrial-like [Dreissena polymorpha]KAH3849886.1 hypothetical protein DPMN_092290 [Dreissena polymorpha]
MWAFSYSRYIAVKRQVLYTACRHLNNSQTAAALRPFYFAVHPDLFGRHPKERSVNEESLKQLHEYVASLQANRSLTLQPVDLVFYVRSQANTNLRTVKISLMSTDVRTTVITILEACGLPLDYVKTVPVTTKAYSKTDWSKVHVYDTESRFHFQERPPPPVQRTLSRWLKENEARVKRYFEASLAAQEEIDRLCTRLVSQVGVASVRWENIWGHRHYIACLRTFNKLCETQVDKMRNTLQGRHLVFGNNTGINLHGEVVLGSEDVATEWMQQLRCVHAYDPMIERFPRMEQELSALLNHVQIVRRQKREFVMAQSYEVLLNRMLNSLRRCQDLVGQELGLQDLSHLVLVVECESGPLALSNEGQFLIPASIPGSLMLKFIAENKDQAATFLIDAKFHTFYMNQILDQCRGQLNVSEISRDDAITPKQMTECCQRLLDSQRQLNPLLQGTKLKVSTYYTLMKDGELTIPWNWVE